MPTFVLSNLSVFKAPVFCRILVLLLETVAAKISSSNCYATLNHLIEAHPTCSNLYIVNIRRSDRT